MEILVDYHPTKWMGVQVESVEAVWKKRSCVSTNRYTRLVKWVLCVNKPILCVFLWRRKKNKKKKM